MNHRKALRLAARTALEGVDFGVDVEILQSWSQVMDPDTLPVLGVMTPRETSSVIDKDGNLERLPQLVVVMKRAGGDDLEDLMDDYADAIEAVVPPAIAPFCQFYELSSTEVIASGEAGTRAFALALTWTCQVFTTPT